jgi:hypothetical protein
MVVGYKGGEYNALGKYYVVRQKHAHAWVEAWMPPGEVPDSEIAGVAHQGGCWYRLDPTPAASQFVTVSASEGFVQRVTETFDYLELMWRDYVVNLNALRQRESVIDPAAANSLGALPAWIDLRTPERWLAQFARRWGLPSPGRIVRSQNPVFDWRFATATALFLAAMVGAAQLAALGIRWLPRALGWKLESGQRRSQAPWFYRRLERLLARMRLRRGTGQTPRELAADAREELTAGAQTIPVAELPGEIVSTYYRVRFGGATLDKAETLAIEHALAALVPAVSDVKQR